MASGTTHTYFGVFVGTLIVLLGAPVTGAAWPPELGPDAGYGIDAPDSSGLGLGVGSGTHRGRLADPIDADWFRIATFPHTTGLLVQVFGVSECVLVAIVKSPGALPQAQLYSVLCPGGGDEVRFARSGPGLAQWGVGILARSAATEYTIHVQVYGGL